MEKVELILPSDTIIAKIGDKKYIITVDEDKGIFIQSDKGVRVTDQSETGNWLYVK